MEINEGILPTIKQLIEVSDQLFKELEPVIDKKNNIYNQARIEDLLKSAHIRLKDLHAKVLVTHDLIESVILSIHSSRNELKKSVDGLIRKTGVQLQKVTSTTEEATNKIMDIAEKLDDDQLKIIDLLDKLKLDNGKEEIIDDIKGKVYKNQDAAFTIIDYLQFQDITAQQIAGAYSLLSDTERTLISVSNLLREFDPSAEENSAIASSVDKKAFNADAAFTDKTNIQSAIDDLFTSHDTSVEIPEDRVELKQFSIEEAQNQSGIKDVSNDDIDALFGNSAINSSKEDEIDIDALFAKPKIEKKEKKNEDFDIDDLFKNNQSTNK
ncbi:MAG: hypothetical protein PHR06_13710 [Candidatus Cloacimonetes bacterium]|nr:hypothetical protein [Candidatus Cloacimonadota bacterium]